MARQLRTTVFVQSPDGEHVRLDPGTDVPDWAEDVIDNPKAWDDYDPDAPEEKPKKRAPAKKADSANDAGK